MKKFSYILASNVKVKIDQSDLNRVSKHSWRVTKGTTGRTRVVTASRVKDKIVTTTLGKFLMKPPKGKQVVPRRSSSELDYRKENLIVCTLQQRQQLLPKKKSKTTSIYRGVSLVRKTKKWRAGIEVDGQPINLGEYNSQHDGARAYNAAARKYFGKFAYQNPVGRKMTKRKT